MVIDYCFPVFDTGDNDHFFVYRCAGNSSDQCICSFDCVTCLGAPTRLSQRSEHYCNEEKMKRKCEATELCANLAQEL